MKRYLAVAMIASGCWALPATAADQWVELGPTDVIAISQPLVEFDMIDPDDGLSDGPDLVAFPIPNKIALADTAAQSVLLAQPAYREPDSSNPLLGSVLVPGKYDREMNDGTPVTYTEQGVSGFAVLEVLEPYQVKMPYTEGAGSFTSTAVRALGDPDLNLSYLGGVIGTAVFEGNSLVLDHEQLVNPDPWVLFGMSVEDTPHVGTKIQPTLPDWADESTSNVYRVPLRRIGIEPEGSDPLPDFGSLYGVEDFAITSGARSAAGTFIADTGAQLSLLLPWMADELSIDYEDPTLDTIEIGGLGGSTVAAPVVHLDRIAMPTGEGVDMVLTDADFAVVEIPGLDTFGLPEAQRIGGILGYNVLTSGYYETVLAQILSDLGVDVVDLIFTEEDGEIPDLENANPGYFQQVAFDFMNPDDAAMYLTVNPSLNTIVPEPATMMALAIGGATFVGRRRRT